MLTLDLKFSITPQQLDLGFDKIQPVTETVPVGDAGDHSKLTNRDLANQHPMKAITGLETALSNINKSTSGSTAAINSINQSIDQINQELDTKVEGEALTNVEVANIWTSVMG